MIIKGGKYDRNPGLVFQALDYDNKPPSISNLTASLTANGITILPSLRYHGKDANITDWIPYGYGQTLTRSFGTPKITTQCESPFFGPDDYSLGFSTSTSTTNDCVFGSTDTTLGNFGTDDIIIELICETPSTANSQVVSHRDVGGAGWYIDNPASTSMCLTLAVAAATSTVSTSTALGLDSVNHIMFFVNRSKNNTEGMVCYINGVQNGVGNPVNVVNSIDSVNTFTIGGTAVGGSLFNRRFFYIAIWHSPAWFSDAGGVAPAQWLAISKARYCQLMNLEAITSKGIILPTYTRASARSTMVTHKNGHRAVHFLSQNSIAAENNITPPPPSFSGKPFRGVSVEPQTTNLLWYSQEPNTGGWPWLRINVGEGYPGGFSPTWRYYATIHSSGETAVNDAHYIYQVQTLTVGKIYTFSTWVAKSNRNFYWLSCDESAGGFNHRAFFNFSNNILILPGSVTNCTSSINGANQDFGNKFTRISMTFMAENSVNHDIKIGGALADGSITYLGIDGNPCIISWGLQLENNSIATSYIRTGGGAVTRAADVLRWNLGNSTTGVLKDNSTGRVECNYLMHSSSLNNVQFDSPTYKVNIFEVTNNGSNNDSITLRTGPVTIGATYGNNILTGTMRSTTAGDPQLSIIGSSDLSVATPKKISLEWAKGDKAEMFIDDVLQGISTNPPSPSFSTTAYLDVGLGSSGTAPLGSISNVKIFKSRSSRRKK